MAGMPGGQHDPLTPAGEYEQLLKFFAGFSRLHGWRRVTVRVAALVALLVILLIFSAAAARLLHL